MVDNLNSMVDKLLPLLRRFPRSEFGIALGGAHAKGVEDRESDLDLYVFARQVRPAGERMQLCRQYDDAIGSVTSWGEDSKFVQAGTDFYYNDVKVECWLRHVDDVSHIVDECVRGIVRREFVTWTVMGFYNHCTLSDLAKMVPLEDPAGILARWKAEVSVYPPKLRERIIDDHLRAAKFWPENYHYRTAVERCDCIYTTGIVQQVVHNLIQVVFALNCVYFSGDKKLAVALDHLAVKPREFSERIAGLLLSEAGRSPAALHRQRIELGALVAELEALADQAMRKV
jgi:hypothetical protein